MNRNQKCTDFKKCVICGAAKQVGLSNSDITKAHANSSQNSEERLRHPNSVLLKFCKEFKLSCPTEASPFGGDSFELCSKCTKNLNNVLETKARLKCVENCVRELQLQIVQELKELKVYLDLVTVQLSKIERSVRWSDQQNLTYNENNVQTLGKVNQVFTLRQSLLNVTKEMHIFKDTLIKKTSVDDIKNYRVELTSTKGLERESNICSETENGDTKQTNLQSGSETDFEDEPHATPILKTDQQQSITDLPLKGYMHSQVSDDGSKSFVMSGVEADCGDKSQLSISSSGYVSGSGNLSPSLLGNFSTGEKISTKDSSSTTHTSDPFLSQIQNPTSPLKLSRSSNKSLFDSPQIGNAEKHSRTDLHESTERSNSQPRNLETVKKYKRTTQQFATETKRSKIHLVSLTSPATEVPASTETPPLSKPKSYVSSFKISKQAESMTREPENAEKSKFTKTKRPYEFSSTQEYIKDFDKVPVREVTTPLFRSKEPVVRKKAERAKLSGWDCPDCKGYYELLKDTMTEEEVAKARNQCSRHRSLYQPLSNTPENFWCTQMPTTQELYRDGYILEGTPFVAPPRRNFNESSDSDNA